MEAGVADLFQTGLIHAKRIASLSLGGSLIAGTDNTTGSFSNNGAIRVDDDRPQELPQRTRRDEPGDRLVLEERLALDVRSDPPEKQACRAADGEHRQHAHRGHRIAFSASASRCFVVSTPSKRSPCCSTRRSTASIV